MPIRIPLCLLLSLSLSFGNPSIPSFSERYFDCFVYISCVERTIVWTRYYYGRAWFVVDEGALWLISFRFPSLPLFESFWFPTIWKKISSDSKKKEALFVWRSFSSFLLSFLLLVFFFLLS